MVLDKLKSLRPEKVAKKTASRDNKKIEKPKKAPKKWTMPFRSFGGYFKGAWQELRQVRWPNRKATWGLTMAVLLFSLLLGAIIFLLDLGFTYLFKEIIL